MKLVNRFKAGPSRRRAIRLALGALAVTVGSGAGLLSLGVGAADASGTYSTLVSASSWLNVAVRGGSTSSGTDLIQWWSDGGAEQQWAVDHWNDYPAGVVDLVNENSGLCITTDGVAGDPLTQQPCSDGNGFQEWKPIEAWDGVGYFLNNPETGLNIDVQGNSYGGGAEIDAWYPNGQLNQQFENLYL